MERFKDFLSIAKIFDRETEDEYKKDRREYFARQKEYNKDINGMKIWLDDLRRMPEDFTQHAHSVNEAKRYISAAEAMGETIELISLDHDLGDYASDGGDGICLMDWLLERQTLYPISFHTANPVGRANMQRMKDKWWK